MMKLMMMIMIWILTLIILLKGQHALFHLIRNNPDPFYFVKIEGEAIAKFDMMDDYNNLIKIDQHYILGHYLEKESCSPKGGLSYSVYTKKTVYFYKESIIYPFVPLHEKQKGKKSTLFISNNEYCDIIHFVEETNMARL